MTRAEDREWLDDLLTTAPAGRVLLTRSGGHAAITIANEPARGALTTRMMQDLCAIADRLASDPPLVWTLQGTGPAFCAGGHLGDVRASLATPDGGGRMARVMADTQRRLQRTGALGIVAVHGPAIGGGAELALWGDICLLQRDARLAFVQAKRGVVAGWGGASRLVARVGPQHALAILVKDPVVSCERAERLGLAIGVDSASAALDEWVSAALELHPDVLRAAIAQVHAPANEAEAFARVWGAEHHQRLLADLPWGRKR